MLRIVPIPAFQDNYLWLFHHQGEQQACVVDPGDAAPVLDYLAQHSLTLSDILVTHHHADHTGGIDGLLARYPAARVHGPRSGQIPQIGNPLQEGDEVSILETRFSVIEVPGHTLDHIAYYHAGSEEQRPLLFCGDTLFVSGCGRIFEGDPEMMYRSLGKLARLPAETQVYCAHEYTLANLAFARAVLPGDPAVSDQLARARELREAGQPTVPSTIARELESNPFLRCHEVAMAESLRSETGTEQEQQSPQQVFAGIRAWKDRFRG